MFCCKTVVIWMDTWLIWESKVFWEVGDKKEDVAGKLPTNIRLSVEVFDHPHQPAVNCHAHDSWACGGVLCHWEYSEMLGNDQPAGVCDGGGGDQSSSD